MKSLTDLAGDLDVSTTQVLTALRIAGTRIGIDEIDEWCRKELEGYGEEDELPAHRIWRLTIKGSLHNPMQGFMQNLLFGDVAIAEEHREKATTFHHREGIWSIEKAQAEKGFQGILAAEHPNLAHLINTGPMRSEAWTCVHATAEFSETHVLQVVNKARQTALSFCLSCEKEGLDLYWGDNAAESPGGERSAWLSKFQDEAAVQAVRTLFDVAKQAFDAVGG